MAQPKKPYNENEPNINDNFNTKETNKSIEENKYPERMQDVFNYLESKPFSIIGQQMQYKRTDKLSNKNRDLTEIYDKLETLDFDTSNKTSSLHHAQVTRGLLYLSMNGIDECHNLVTPLSWSSYTSFGGKYIDNSPANQNACYSHALTHRREGQYIGEFGTGWNNSCYWFGQTGKHKILFPKIAKYATDIVYNNHDQNKYKNNKQITKFLQSILVIKNKNNKQFDLQWDPQSFSNLCEKAVKQRDNTLMSYCQDVANKEWRLLIDHCYTFI